MQVSMSGNTIIAKAVVQGIDLKPGDSLALTWKMELDPGIIALAFAKQGRPPSESKAYKKWLKAGAIYAVSEAGKDIIAQLIKNVF